MSKGGSPDTSGMQESRQMSNELQKQMYEESIARGKPFYDVGVGGIQKLGDYLGIDRTPQQRQSIYDQLLPEYTTQTGGTQGGYNGNLYGTFTGGEQLTPQQQAAREAGLLIRSGRLNQSDGQDEAAGFEQRYGMSPQAYQTMYEGGALGGGTTTSSVDYTGLNAAVDAQLGSQERPDYFGSLLDPFSAEKFQADPSYAFRQAEGEKALARSAAARGQTFAPSTGKALQEYGQNLASQEYNNAYNRYNADQSNIYNRLAGISGMGQQQVAQADMLGSNYATNVGQTNISLANAQAAAAQQASQNKKSMFGTLGTLGGAAIGGAFGGLAGAKLGAGLGGTLGGY